MQPSPQQSCQSVDFLNTLTYCINFFNACINA